MKYPRLEREMLIRGIKKPDIALHIRIAVRSLNNKLKGITRFSWDEACRIQAQFFPDLTKDELFQVDESQTEQSA